MCYFGKSSIEAGLQHTGVSVVQMSEDTGCPNQPARNVNSAKISQGNFNDSFKQIESEKKILKLIKIVRFHPNSAFRRMVFLQSVALLRTTALYISDDFIQIFSKVAWNTIVLVHGSNQFSFLLDYTATRLSLEAPLFGSLPVPISVSF